MKISYHRKSKFDISETLSNVVSAAKKLGFEVVGQTELEKDNTHVISVVDRKATQKILQTDPNLTGLIPSLIAVIKRNEDVIVAAVNPELLAGLTPNHDIQQLSVELAQKIKNAVNEATGAGEQKVSNVKLYSTHTCPYCKMEKEWLEKSLIKHETVYLEESEKDAEYMVKATGQMGVPVTEIVYEDGESEFVVGFDKNRLSSILAQ